MSQQSGQNEPASDVPDDAFARTFAQALRGRRRSFGWSLDRMVRHAHEHQHPDIDAAILEDFESGELTGDHRRLIRDVADTYDLDLAQVAGPRTPIGITDDAFVIGEVRVPWYSEHIDDVLVAFLEMIRTVRRRPEVEVSSFRRVDIEAIAAHFDRTPAFLLERLGELIGASDTRMAAMSTMLKSGGQVIPTGAEDETAEDAPASPSRLVALLSGAPGGG